MEKFGVEALATALASLSNIQSRLDHRYVGVWLCECIGMWVYECVSIWIWVCVDVGM